jgi:hypothetical protein
MMNPGLVHSSDVWHSLRRVAGIMATARRNPVSSSEGAARRGDAAGGNPEERAQVSASAWMPAR